MATDSSKGGKGLMLAKRMLQLATQVERGRKVNDDKMFDDGHGSSFRIYLTVLASF